MDGTEISHSLKDYDYNLPAELIAHRPCPQRGGSRLMSLERNSGETTTHRFSDLPRFLNRGDCVVLNDTMVIPARLKARKVLDNSDAGLGAQLEVFLLRDRGDGSWEALVKRGKRVKVGTNMVFGDRWYAKVEDVSPSGTRVLRFKDNCAWKVIEEMGEVPLPPYIERDEPDDRDRERYQTVYAKVPGAVAAPTAGLHFTQEILDALSARGVSIAYVTLHVSYGTFRPIMAEDIRRHKVQSEYFELPARTAEIIGNTKASGGKVVATGTTTCRVLESCARNGHYAASKGWTDLYIRPPFEFRTVDMLLTNFHLPRSSLLVLTCAFAGRRLVLDAYEKAIREKFRFYSYGDAMLIL